MLSFLTQSLFTNEELRMMISELENEKIVASPNLTGFILALIVTVCIPIFLRKEVDIKLNTLITSVSFIAFFAFFSIYSTDYRVNYETEMKIKGLESIIETNNAGR